MTRNAHDRLVAAGFHALVAGLFGLMFFNAAERLSFVKEYANAAAMALVAIGTTLIVIGLLTPSARD